jgi:hypothetical protein
MNTQKAGIALVVPLFGALAVLGGIGSFATIRHAAEPYFGELAWIPPIGLDVGILGLLALDLLLEYLDMAWPILRWVAWSFIGGTIAVNVNAAHGDFAGSILHASLPILFIVAMEGLRYMVRHQVGLTTGSRIERIPVSRWLLAPFSTALLWRRMVLWHVTAYRDGLRLEHERLQTVCDLQQRYGRFAWRWSAPLADRLALRLQSYDAYAEHDLKVGESCELVDLARDILAENETGTVRVSNARLGQLLRARGATIANDRLTQIANAARSQPTREVA